MDMSSLKRAIYPMPEDVKSALRERGLVERYEARPPYQRNDYIGWITRAKRRETRQKRLAQMLEELMSGTAYMGMKYHAEKNQGMGVADGVAESGEEGGGQVWT